MILLLLHVTFVTTSPELRLRNDLMHDYNPLERPVERSEDPVVVTLGVIFQQIIDLNEREEKLEINAWLKYNWKDIKLRWDPLEYENITDLRHPAGSIWQPDILLYNSVDSAFDSTFKVNAISYNDGSITWIPPGIFKISCKIDIYWFPFDEQVCFLKFGSWSFSGREIDLQPGDFDMSDFIENGEWIIIKTWEQRNEKFYECCPEPYPDVRFFIHLKRRTLYYAFNLIMPCMMTLILIVLGFTLSPDTCEKIGLQISVSLAICIFMTLMNEMTPLTSEAVPLLGIFFLSCMAISVAATSFTVYVQAVHFRNPDTQMRMNFWMRYILLEWAPFVLRMKQPKRENTLETIKQGWKGRKNRNEDDRTAFTYDDGHVRLKLTQYGKHDQHLLQRLNVLDRIHKHVKDIREKTDDMIEEKRIANEWRFAAMVVDRIGLILFSIVIAITSLTIALRAPYLVA
ncbi:Acetylcholine receptor subunit alpha-type acr-16 [Dirofilaria immitis]|nr:Acetylcholine receptor subunit alpha-type acr-16 [Dirofilaria immitis]